MLNSITAEQKNSLQTMQGILGLVADIAHATTTIYLQSQDKKWLHIYCQELAQTQQNEQLEVNTGRKVRCIEEPLVWRCLQKNVPLMGRREIIFGVYSSFFVYPLQDKQGKVYGAVAFETAVPDKLMIEHALELLKHPRNIADKFLYGRLNPETGLMVVDVNRVVIAANNTAKHIFQFNNVPELVGTRTNSVTINWPLVGMVIDAGIGEYKELDMNGLLLSVRILPIIPRPKAGCALVILEDITELKKKDEELRIKSVVIKEIHHRVKNNLQTIASLLRLQMRRAQCGETLMVLKDCISRVNSIAIVHEYLSKQDSGLIDVDKVAKNIYNAIIGSMLDSTFKLEAEFQADAVQLPSEKATSIALILNELLQNSIEHGFENRVEGKLKISFLEGEAGYVLEIADNGNGLPPGFDLHKNRKSLGLKIISIMAESDLQGKFTLENRAGGGTVARVNIPYGGVGNVK